MLEIALKIINAESMQYEEAAKLKYFRVRFKRFVFQLVARYYKTITVLMKLFPEARDSQDESIFDKIYIMQVFLQGLNKQQIERYQ